MHEQLEALWESRDKDQPSVKGILLTNTNPAPYDRLEESSPPAVQAQLGEKWFVLLGHSMFYCKQRDSAEYSGAYLTDVFNPVIARVSKKLLETFQLPETDGVRMHGAASVYCMNLS